MPGLNFEQFGAAIEKALTSSGEARPADALTSSGEARAELPAFLEGGDKLPAGYEWEKLLPEEGLVLGLGPELGASVLCYLGNGGVNNVASVGVRMTRESDGVYLSFQESPFLKYRNARGVKFEGNTEKVVIISVTGTKNIVGPIPSQDKESWFYLPYDIEVAGRHVPVCQTPWNGVKFAIGKEGIIINNNDLKTSTSTDVRPLSVAVPAAAMVRPASVPTSRRDYGEMRPAGAPVSSGGARKGEIGTEAGRGSVQKRMAGAIRELVELGKNREAPNLGRRAGKAVAELLTAMGEAEPGLIEKLAGAALGKENPAAAEITMFFGRVVGTAVRMKAEIISPTPHFEETELFISLKSLLVLSKEPDSPSRQEDAGYDLGRILTNLSRVDAGVRDRLVAAGLNKKANELTEEDMLIFFGRVVGTAVEMKAKL